MKLNPNCIKIIMLILQNEIIPGEDIFIDILTYHNYSFIYFIDFSEDDFLEHLNQCISSGLISGKNYIVKTSQVFHITAITSKGYKFLINSTDNFIWTETLKVFNKAQIKSISTLTEILEEFFSIEISKVIKNY